MQPGKTIDRDHINRFQQYVDVLRDSITANTELDFNNVSGLLVADNLAKQAGMTQALQRLASDGMKAMEWESLLAKAEAQWEDFLKIVVNRAPDDERLSSLRRTKKPEGAERADRNDSSS